MKKTVMITLDPDVWLAFHMQVDDRNRSGTINDLLKSFLAINQPTADEEELLVRIESLQENQRTIFKELALLSAELAIIRKNKDEEMKKFRQEILDFHDGY